MSRSTVTRDFIAFVLFLDGRIVMAGEICSATYKGDRQKFRVEKIGGDFGDREIKEKVSIKEDSTISDIHSKLTKLQLTEPQEQMDVIASTGLPKNERTSLNSFVLVPDSSKFMYYISQMDTVIDFEREKPSNQRKLSPTKVRENVISYQSIGGFSMQMEAIRETIELPLKHPNIFLECGWYF